MIVNFIILLHFLIVTMAGLVACGVLWKFSAAEFRRTVFWRILFCTLLAATITPTRVPFIFDSSFLMPAVEAIIFGLFDHRDVEPKVNLFLVGVLPVLGVASTLFLLLTLWQKRFEIGDRKNVP